MVLPLLPVQKALNRYWMQREPTSAPRERLSPPEVVIIACGAAAMSVVATAALIGVEK